MSEAAKQVAAVVPVSTLRRRKALQFCFTPMEDDPPGSPRRATSTAIQSPIKPTPVPPPPKHYAHLHQPTSPRVPSSCALLGKGRYVPENYEDEITLEELDFYVAHQARVLEKDNRKERRPLSGPQTNPPKEQNKASPSADAVPTPTSPRSSKAPPSPTKRRSTYDPKSPTSPRRRFTVDVKMSEFLNIPLEPETTLDGDEIVRMITRREDLASPERTKLVRKKGVKAKYQLEERDEVKGIVNVETGKKVLIRRMAYIPPPEKPIAWMPVSAEPKKPETGRFSPKGGFYIRPTIDDEFFSASNERSVREESASRKAMEAQAASFRRLARPNTVTNATTTQEEGKILSMLARRDSQSSMSPLKAAVVLLQSIGRKRNSPDASKSNDNASPATEKGATPLRGNSPTAEVGVKSPAPTTNKSGPFGNSPDPSMSTPAVKVMSNSVFSKASPVLSSVIPELFPYQPPKVDERLLALREQIPITSRSSGCVGAAEIHYWLEMGHNRVAGYKRDTESCVAQVWIRRSVAEESYSVKTVLRNYATRIPPEAVLAVSLRGITFGKRTLDITITFTYGEVKNDPQFVAVANTIRRVLKDSMQTDAAKFRGPFLMCSADKELCEYLRAYCLGMSSAEHPELAVLGFPGAHVSESKIDESQQIQQEETSPAAASKHSRGKKKRSLQQGTKRNGSSAAHRAEEVAPEVAAAMAKVARRVRVQFDEDLRSVADEDQRAAPLSGIHLFSDED